METMLMQELGRLADRVNELEDVKFRIRSQRNRLEDEMLESITELDGRFNAIDAEQRELRLAIARIRSLVQQYKENDF